MSIINPFSMDSLYDLLTPSFFDLPTINKNDRRILSNMRNRLFSDMVVNHNSYQYFIDMPGFKKEDIKVKYDDKYIYIEGFRENIESHGEESRKFTSRSMGQFKEQMPLYEDADRKNIKCSFKDGVLSVTVSRKEPVNKNMLSDVNID